VDANGEARGAKRRADRLEVAVADAAPRGG
jgi:hypothetical protein